MSFHSAICDILAKMKEESSKSSSQPLRDCLDKYVFMLEISLKSTQNSEPVITIKPRHDKDLSDKAKLANFEEKSSPSFYVLVGGSSDGTMVPVEGTPPEGAKTMIGNEVYINSSGEFIYSEIETRKINSRISL